MSYNLIILTPCLYTACIISNAVYFKICCLTGRLELESLGLNPAHSFPFHHGLTDVRKLFGGADLIYTLSSKGRMDTFID